MVLIVGYSTGDATAIIIFILICNVHPAIIAYSTNVSILYSFQEHVEVIIASE